MLIFADFQIPNMDFYQLVPILALGFIMVASLLLELRDDSEEPTQSVTSVQVGLGVITLCTLIGYYLSWDGPSVTETFNGMLINDPLSRGGGLLVAACALLALLAAPEELEANNNHNGGEFCALIAASSLGMVLMLSAGSTIVMFLGLELFSLALYLLCIFFPEQRQSRESGMKYFLLSSAASAVLLYGLALLYGAVGSTWLSDMQFNQGALDSGIGLIGMAFVLSGLLFKVAAVPFHFWAPDVYHGAPTTVTAYMSVATKVAALVTLWRFLASLGGSSGRIAILILFSLAVLSMIVGNFLALSQQNVKRMLAYSGVANAGYILMAPVVGYGLQGPMMFFLAAYLVGNIGAFLAVARIETLKKKEIMRADLVGLFKEHPLLSGLFAVCLFSLTGFPPTAGFLGKFYLFGKTIAAGQIFLPAIGIIGSLIGAGYYLTTAALLFKEPEVDADDGEVVVEAVETEDSPVSLCEIALGLCAFGVLALGLFPSSLLEWFGSI